MQYTIHFINECDLFLRKIQQQFGISSKEIGDVDSKCAADSPRKTNSMKEKTSVAKRIYETNVSNNQESKTETEGGLIINERLSARLVKSIPKVEPIKPKTSPSRGLLRTPTKGGSSAFNIGKSKCGEDDEKTNKVEPVTHNADSDEKNMVSKRLRQVLDNSDRSQITPSKKICPTIDGEYFQERPKDDDEHSVIIIDSDEDDEYVRCAQFECIGSKEVKFDAELEVGVEGLVHVKNNHLSTHLGLKKLSVLLEKMDTERIMRDNGVRMNSDDLATISKTGLFYLR